MRTQLVSIGGRIVAELAGICGIGYRVPRCGRTGWHLWDWISCTTFPNRTGPSLECRDAVRASANRDGTQTSLTPNTKKEFIENR